MATSGAPKRKRGSITILALFVVLFGGGLFVYGVADGRPVMTDSIRHQQARTKMVASQIAGRDIKDERVIAAVRSVPRHLFVPEDEMRHAYEDRALPIGLGQTISQPYMVAAMAELAQIGPNDRVLEVGTGSGYGAAVLSKLARHVYSVEIIQDLAKRAQETLDHLGYDNVTVIVGDGRQGLASEQPFDAIVVTAAPEEVPSPLLEQLAIGGHLVIPVGTDRQRLEVYERTKEGVKKYHVFDVSFVPMTGEVDPRAAK